MSINEWFSLKKHNYFNKSIKFVKILNAEARCVLYTCFRFVRTDISNINIIDINITMLWATRANSNRLPNLGKKIRDSRMIGIVRLNISQGQKDACNILNKSDWFLMMSISCYTCIIKQWITSISIWDCQRWKLFLLRSIKLLSWR